MPRPNLLFIITHDTGQHLGCYGHGSVETPNLDRLASEGIRFDRYYCTAPQCSPSRGSIITGRFPHVNGLMGLVNRGWNLPNEEATMPLLLREAGYDTHLFGFQHEKQDARDLGCCYNWISERGERPMVANIGPQVEAFLRDPARQAAERPFFAMVGFSETHRPFEGYGESDPATVEIPPYLPDHPAVRKDLAQFEGCVRTMDAGVGWILQALAEADLADDTLVVYTTDHGIAFPRAKCNLYEAGLLTALLMRWPQGFAGERTHSELLSNVDLLPTLLDIAGAPIPDNLNGRSFGGLLTASDYEPRTEIFAEKTWHDKYDPMRGIRTERYKYIRSYDPHDLVDMPVDIFKGPSGQAVKDRWKAKRPRDMLFDLDTDPLEERNLADDPAHADTLRDLSERLDVWMASTSDPMLEGHVAPPRPSKQLSSWVDPPSPAALEACCHGILDRHLELLNEGDLDAALEDVADDHVLVTNLGIYHGREEVRRVWEEVMMPSLAGLQIHWDKKVIEGDIMLLEWHASDADDKVKVEGVTTIIIGDDGLMHRQTGSLKLLD